VECIVRDLLWSDVESHVHKGYVVGKCSIDCTQKPLPAPLQEGSKVVVLCGIRLGSYTCLTAAEATIANLNRVQQWVDELRSGQGDPVLLQIHEHLIEDADLIRKSKVRSPHTFILNGENLRPFVFGGAVVVMEPIPRIAAVTVPRMTDVSVSRVLFGELSEHQIRVACKSNNCASATVGVKVVGYCRVGEQAAAASDCLMSVSPPRIFQGSRHGWWKLVFRFRNHAFNFRDVGEFTNYFYVGLFGNRRKH